VTASSGLRGVSRRRFGVRRRGLTLLEAIASMALLAVGIAAVVGALGGIIRADTDQRDRERLFRLAAQKLDELRGTGDFTQLPLEGDFADRGEANVTWEAALEPTGTENLEALRVTAQRTARASTAVTVETVLFRTPVVTGGSGIP